MYDFLAPWGILAPAVCFLFSYFHVKNLRRNKLLKTVHVSEPTVFLSGVKPRSNMEL